jgi:hypothetical protein
MPYYAQVAVCPEDNCRTIVNQQYAVSLKSSTPFNIPACGAVAQVVIPGLTQIALYSRLWAYGFGYLTVTAFDPATQTVTVRNDCNTSCSNTQAPVGTQVPACTLFVVTPADCDTGSSGGVSSAYPYVAAQFTAPANGDCLDIAVTNTNGLAVGKLIQIAGGTYLLQTIKSSTLITICNQGQGVTPGTIVNAQDGAGNYITPIVLVDSNPCTNTAVFSGKMLVCKNNLIQPLAGSANNQVPVYNQTTGEVNFRDLLIPVGDCTNLTTCFTVDPALPVGTQYLITVANTGIFAVGDLIVIQGTAFTVSSILNGTQMRIVPVAHPTAIQTYNVGAAVCDADCCTVISNDITNINNQITTINNTLTVIQSNPNLTPCSTNLEQRIGAITIEGGDGTGGILSNGQDATGPEAQFIVQNTSPCRNMVVMYTLDWEYEARIINGTSIEGARVQYRPQLGLAVGPNGSTGAGTTPTVVATFSQNHQGLTNSFAVDNTFSRSYTAVLPPGIELNIRASANVQHLTGDSNQLDWSALRTRLSTIRVAM